MSARCDKPLSMRVYDHPFPIVCQAFDGILTLLKLYSRTTLDGIRDDPRDFELHWIILLSCGRLAASSEERADARKHREYLSESLREKLIARLAVVAVLQR